ncbi:MAG: hypothetical protein ACRC35_11250 [Angustibacter sp.]
MTAAAPDQDQREFDVVLYGASGFVGRLTAAHLAEHAPAGARIVHACGFDSVPSDLGVLLLHEQAAADGADGLTETTLVATMRGGFGPGLRGRLGAHGAAVALGGFAAAMGRPLPRRALDRLLPAPGAGPSPASRAAGFFRMRLHAVTTGGVEYRSTVAAQGDPGYSATSVMLGESALALVLDELPPAAGVLTPATGIGRPLAERLRRQDFTVHAHRA